MTTDSRIAYRPNEAARQISMSRDVIYKAIRDGSLRSLKVGGARLITRDALQEFVQRHEQAQSEPGGA